MGSCEFDQLRTSISRELLLHRYRYDAMLARLRLPTRLFSTCRPTRQQYLIIAQDIDDANTLERRIDARPAHLNSIDALLESGNFLMGGAMLNDGSPIGSALLLEAKDITHVREILKSDPYVKEQVWDVQRIQIIPFKLAVEGFTKASISAKK